VPEQRQRAVDGGGGQPPLGSGFALADLPYDGQPSGLVLADTAVPYTERDGTECGSMTADRIPQGLERMV
jgi:hypothetical protein